MTRAMTGACERIYTCRFTHKHICIYIYKHTYIYIYIYAYAAEVDHVLGCVYIHVYFAHILIFICI